MRRATIRTWAIAAGILAVLVAPAIAFGPWLSRQAELQLATMGLWPPPPRPTPLSRARSQVQTMMAALDLHFAETGRYPGTASEGWADDENAFPALFDAIFTARGKMDPLMQFKEQDVLVLDDDRRGYRRAEVEEIYDPKVRKYLADPWGRPYVYRENKSRAPRSFMRNPSKYDIYSTGADREDQTFPGIRPSDDIGSW
jgi:hypothetical protein